MHLEFEHLQQVESCCSMQNKHYNTLFLYKEPIPILEEIQIIKTHTQAVFYLRLELHLTEKQKKN